MPRETLRKFVATGPAVIVGTVDAEGVATCCRGIAITSKDDFETVTVYVPAATAQETIANVATTRRIAVACTHPLSHESVQVKGVTRGVRLAPPADEELVRSAFSRFGEVLEQIGLPHRIMRTIAHWPAFAIDFSVEQVFDQTPGPRAGAQIE